MWALACLPVVHHEQLLSRPVRHVYKLWKTLTWYWRTLSDRQASERVQSGSGSSYSEAAPSPPPAKFMSDRSYYSNQSQTHSEGLTLAYLAMLEGPGVHLVNKWDYASLKSYYVPCQKKKEAGSDRAINLFSVLPVFRGSVNISLCVVEWKTYSTSLVWLCQPLSVVFFSFFLKNSRSVLCP